MSNELKFIPTSMTDLENLPKSAGVVIKENTGSKIFLSDNHQTSKTSLFSAFSSNDKGHHFTTIARSGSSSSVNEDDMPENEMRESEANK